MTTNTTDPTADEEFLADFRRLSTFGAVPGTGGVDRQAGTPPPTVQSGGGSPSC